MKWFRELYFNTKYIIIYTWERNWPEVSYSFYKLRSDFFYPVYNLFKQIGVICSYLPVLWKDRDWDGSYFLYLARYKLSRMEKCIRHGSYVNCEKDADKIKKTIDMLDRMIADEYEEIFFKPHDEKWGKPKMSWKDVPNHPGCCEAIFERSGVKTKEDEEMERKEFMETMKLAEKEHQNDYNKFFGMLARNLRRWWD